MRRDAEAAGPSRLLKKGTGFYAEMGRPSIAPEQLLRAMLLQAFYSVRSERQLMKRVDHDLLFRWFIGLAIDDVVWNPSTFSKNAIAYWKGIWQPSS